ncbi:MAG TPA: CBS domain-containing protein [Methanoregulaceae archaeon]|nr:CBS domain-containing protein [Methanoregulaceae archaeon]
MKAADVMSAPVRVIAPDETVAHARKLMVRYRISRLPVIDDEALTGIVTKKDLGYRLRQSEPAWRRRPIDSIPIRIIAVPDPVTVAPSSSIREVASIFLEHSISGVPVVEGDEVAGIVTKSDIMRSASFQNLVLPVSDLMEDVLEVSRLHSLDHVIDIMSERNDKVVVVNSDGTLAGIITETNLAFFDSVERIARSGQKDAGIRHRRIRCGTTGEGTLRVPPITAEDIMTSPVHTTPPDTPVFRAVSSMNAHRVNSLVVLDGTDIVGIIRRDDIIREVAK